MKKFIYLLLVSLVLLSCTSNTIYKKPKNLISKDKMVNILTDMYLAESAKPVMNKDSARMVDYLPLVYEKYKIDSLQFAESNFYYTSRIDDYEDIFKKVDSRLKEMKKVYETIDRKEDSIRQIKLYGKGVPPLKPAPIDHHGEDDEGEIY